MNKKKGIINPPPPTRTLRELRFKRSNDREIQNNVYLKDSRLELARLKVPRGPALSASFASLCAHGIQQTRGR